MAVMTRDGACALARLAQANRPDWEHHATLAAIFRIMAARGQDTSAATISIGVLAAADDPFVESASKIPLSRSHWVTVNQAFLTDRETGRRYADRASARAIDEARRARTARPASRRGYLAATALLQSRADGRDAG